MYVDTVAKDLNKMNQAVEDAVKELVNIFMHQALAGSGSADEHSIEASFSGATTNGSIPLSTEVGSTDDSEQSDEQMIRDACVELTEHFKHRLVESLIRATRISLDVMRKRFFSRGGGMLHFEDGSGGTSDIRIPFFTADITLAIPNVVMQPSLEDIQSTLNKACQLVLDVSKGVLQWGQDRNSIENFFSSSKKKSSTDCIVLEQTIRTYYKPVAENKDVSKYVMMMSSAVSSLKGSVLEALQRYSDYAFLWEKDRQEAVTEFTAENPILSEYKAKVTMFKKLETNIDDIATSEIVGPIELFTESLKLALRVEIKQWKLMFGRELNANYKIKLDDLLMFIDDNSKRLSRPIRDLEDVRQAMTALADIRENQIHMDMSLGPIEESYAMLNDFGVTIPKEEHDKVDTMRYSFQKLIFIANQTQDNLVRLQPGFKKELLSYVEVFHKDVGDYTLNYDIEGPMAEGISPVEANDRLQVFQSQFDDLWTKFSIYSAGEQLFGLTVTDYPTLARIKKELNLLQKLYGLYGAVMTSINGYFDILWTEVDIEKINQELSDLQNSESCPLLELMANKAMKERHWDRMAKLTGHTFDFDSENFTLRDIMKAPLLKYKEDIEDICISAVKEKDIEAKLSQVVTDWNARELSFANFKVRGELLLKGGETSEIVALLEDSLMILSSLLSNRYNAPFKKKIQQWVGKLSNTTDILESWLIVQNLWVYLEAVFVGGDIAKQLPQEAKRFQNIDKSWVKIMVRAHEMPNVVACCTSDETMGQLLPHLLEQLELCQKSLTGYLEKKRLVFPRFFFISDPSLLEILGQASDSHTIQLETPVMAKGNVELWLGEILREQMKSLHGVIRDAFRTIGNPDFELLGFLNDFQAQVGLLGIQMIWTRDAEEALTLARADKKIMPTTNQRFLDMLNKLIDQTTHDLTKVERIKFETLVTIHVHQRDIFDDLTRMHIKSPTDFEWLKQARFYFKEDTDTCIVQITDVDFIYQNEFLGCTDRLVITPLTDRCYITLAQALGMSMGGAPAGPAGTGKTETTKDMGKALGKYVVVFNCSDQMDFRGLGRIYKGLAQSGSWGCFDEFNRIELPVLSVAAQQIYIVLTAKKDRKKEFVFTDGDNVDLNPEFGLFLTMNPGYAGRQELPENLKVQFRTVSMMVPDRQVHYDFGLRNILSVLRTLGSNKRARPNDTESTIVMRVLRDMNLSKLVDEDEPLFMSLIADLFPGITLDSATYAELQVAVAGQVEAAGLINHPSWNLKVVQLYETQCVRHGMMTLGPSGAGKSCCIHVLMKAMTDCGAPHREMKMNPKAITAPQMFGRLDNLNSVLDDNKTLTLANGDRIPMAPNCKIVFEVHNIDNASPATVSRNGMVFMSSSALDWRPILQGWLKTRTAQEGDLLYGFFDRVFDDVYRYVNLTLNMKMDILECNQIRQRDDKGNLPAHHLEKLFIFAIMWSLGALLELEDRAKMERFMVDNEVASLPPIKDDETMFEYLVNEKGEWIHWMHRVDEYLYPADSVPDFSSILVPNVDNVRTNFLIDTIAKQYKAVLLIGEPGTAKTVMIKGNMAKYNPDVHLGKSFNFSSASTPCMFQRTIESYVDKRMGSTYGPPGGRRMTVFVDDINMPIINEWGDQVTNEITRQMMEMHGMYSLDKPGDFISIVDLQFIAAMIHPGGGRNDIPERLKRQFCIFNCTLPSNNSIDKIFGIIGCGYFCPTRFEPEVKMLPTPAKFHYIFNLRDLSRIWEGMLKVKGEECRDVRTTLGLWKHECTRVIADRFTNAEDKKWFEKAMTSICQNNVGEEYLSQLPEEPIFVDFLREAPEPTGEESEDAVLEAPKIYETVYNLEILNEKLKMNMIQYNETVRGGSMDLVFFKDAMVHLIKISRIIRTPRGNALLYLYRVAGGEGNGITFIFTDNEIKDEAFLEYLNNVLSSGEVSNLFAKDELDEITQELIPIMKKEFPRRPPTPETLYDYFISRARNNLHCVLCFSPVGEKFRNRSLKFPGLISGCTMDWFSKWPRDALVAVSNHFLSNFDVVCSPEIKQQLVNNMGVVHDNVASVCVEYFQRFRRQTHVTPKSYLSFLDGYITLYKQKHEEIGELAQRMNTGLEKLIEASVSVDQLSKELVVKEKDLAVANVKADKVVKDRAQNLVDEINVEKDYAEGKLEAAKPALAEAERALQTIKSSDIATVKKLGKPPHLIMRIMDCVLLLFQKKIDTVTQDPERPCPKPSWSESLKDTINGETVELLEPYLRMEDFNLETAKKVCSNVAGLLSWATAMAFFYGINKEVLPLKANLAVQEAKLGAASVELNKAQAQLDEKQKELDAVQALYDGAMKEKQELLDDAESCKRRMVAASALIGGLGGEKIRWTEQSKQFKSQIERLVGDVLLCTGFLSYSGPFNQEFRNKLIGNWQKEMYQRKIPFTTELNLINMLVDNATIGDWNMQGLPNDDLSIQNGIITTKATRYPLLIDPQGQGKSWIKNREKDRELQVCSCNLKTGNMHCLHLSWLCSLMKTYTLLNTNVKVGDKECDIMNDFYLYITTKLANPAYTPEVSARTSIIDFTVTIKGLEDQLLGRGSLVDDESLITVLGVTKVTASEVSEKLTVAAETEIKINEAREEFRPVATRGSILYFLICDMTIVNKISDKSPVPAKRIQNIIDYLTFESFRYTCRGLYEEHKFLFVLLMTFKIDMQQGCVKHDEFQTFIKGGAALDLNAVTPKPFRWISDITWLNLVQLSGLGQFSEILNQVTRNNQGWKAWFDTDAPEEEIMPDGYNAALDSFKKLLLIRCWCPDRTVPQARKYISDSMGSAYAEAVLLNLEATWEEKFRAISMGQGQEVHARKLIHAFMQTGGWTLLQNCHLGLNFMDELLDTLVQTPQIHENFRGIKAGLKRTYAGISQDYLDVCSMPQWKPILFGVSFLHTVVQASVQFCQNHLDDMDMKKGVSWVTVRYMLGEVQYGGRVTDDYDKRLLNTFARVWFGDFMFADSFQFYTGYKIPKVKTYDMFMQHIELLPLVDSPEAFGLHPNADITYQTNMAANILDTTMSIQPKEGGAGAGESRETVVFRMAEDMLDKLPADYIPHEVKDRLRKMGHLHPVNIFLKQEIDRMQRVINIVRITLSDLKLAIEGTIIMSENLRDALDNMFDAKVPNLWRKISWQSSTLGFWYTELLERNEQFNRWIFQGRPDVFWMTGLFNPQGFLTAMRQEVTRAHKGWALDSVTLHNDVLKASKEDITSPPAEGVYIFGLYLDGASWDRRNCRLAESHPKVLFTLLPVVHMYAINSTAPKDPRLYQCPIYKKPQRTDLTYISFIVLKTTQSPDHWTLRGGIKAGLKRTYAGISQDYLDVCSMPQWKPILFGVSFLHTVVQASVQFCQNHLDDMDMKKGVSWVTVRYMLGEVQYGGRVTDDYDKRLLNTFARVWFGDFMFADSFQFYTGYKIPKVKTYDMFMQHIELLPLVDSPEAFGLHPNADITYQTNMAANILDTTMSIQPKEGGAGAGESRETVVFRMAEDMLDKLPADYIPHEVKDRLRKMGHLHPVNIFLKQEIDRMQRVINIVRITLSDLKLAIEGTIIMSENLRDALDNMFDAKVPNLWRKISWQSSTLGFWYTELLERNEQFNRWIFQGRPDVFWMTGLFNPQGFLTAMRQEVTRAHKGWALDSVTLHNDVLKASKEDITSPPAEGVYIFGLYLDGASWDRRNCRLAESHPKVLFTLLPVVHMYAINSTAPKDPRLYQCPIYKKPQRTDLTYISFIVLKTTQSPDHWTLRGGIKAGLKRTYAGISQDYLDVCSMPQWKPILFGVSFLHTVVQASVQFCQNHLDDMDMKKGVSWVTVRYMLGEVQYGGRVTDDYDKRLLNTFARVWFGDFMFADSFQFYTGYKIPKVKTYDMFMQHIELLPLVDSPEAFGLHPNADITYQTNMAANILDTTMSIQPKEGGAGAGESRETVVFRMAEDMLDKLPADYIPHEVKDRLRKMGHLHPVNIFLKQEIDRMQRVINIVRITLSDLKLAIEGTIIMSENLRDALDNMFDAKVPNLWRKISWQSSTLGFWYTELLERNEQFNRWIFQGRPDVFWMTGLFNPQGFLTAMRQEVTRAHKGWALDSVTLHNDVLKASKEDITSPPAEGVYIFGLYLDGASWDRRNCRLAESHPKVLFTLLPVVHMYAINSTAPKDPRLYQCPIYKKPQRTDLTYISFIVLKTTQSPDHWTLRGGIKAGLKRTYAGISQDYLDVCSMPQWKPILFGVSFLHTVVQERRKFGPLGWNIPYEFNSSDWQASVQFCQNHLDDMDMKKGVSWVTVRYMLGEVQYGGRVTDDYDKRLLNTFARVWFGDFMFADSFQFYTGYKIPKVKTYDMFMQHIELLPLVDSPEAFGLHPNADITYQTNMAANILDTTMSIQPKEGGAGAGESRETVVFRMAEDMLDKLPADYIPHEVKDRLRKMGHLHPVNIFLKQEIDRMQRVINIVRITLSDLKLAIEGTIIMSENLRDALDNMFDAKVPNLWRKISWQSSTLGFWYTELLERNEQFNRWIFQGRPDVFWMTGLFNPQGFLTAMRQEVTRAHKGWALDSVTLHNDVLKASKEDITSPPAEGVYIFGLYLDGASWDRRNCRLAESHPKVLFTLLPVVHMYAINSTAPKDPRLYQCPIYKKPQRTDLTYISFIVLKTTQSPDHWTLRGVGALCDIK
ncbi:DYH8-like protein [Mya arenaria]|uniref:DYH8-like protein n=2 Tax=Mya arenaria TaxID=6604 RepID=A0ABY7D8R5_MYAAR|nr:DYH8-like protein [Mya arenaria]